MLRRVRAGYQSQRILLHDGLNGGILVARSAGLVRNRVAASLAYRILKRAPAKQRQSEVGEGAHQSERRDQGEDAFQQNIAARFVEPLRGYTVARFAKQRHDTLIGVTQQI